jgi:deoxyxylulose-5-phosphate synthase
MIALPDSFLEQGSQGILRKNHGLDADGIAAEVLAFTGRREIPAQDVVSRRTLSGQ